MYPVRCLPVPPGVRALQVEDLLSLLSFMYTAYQVLDPFIVIALWGKGSYPVSVSLRRMVSSGILRLVALVRTDVSEELSASFIRVTRIGETSVLTRATRRNIPEDTILHSHRREISNLTISLFIHPFPTLSDGTCIFHTFTMKKKSVYSCETPVATCYATLCLNARYFSAGELTLWS
jgi:hypothetical protein